MVFKILNSKNIKKCTLKRISLSKSKKYLIWIFQDKQNNEYVGFTPAIITYGNKTYIWYSILSEHFLPPSYTINLTSIINKTCYINLNNKNIVYSIIPISQSDDKTEEEILFT